MLALLAGLLIASNGLAQADTPDIKRADGSRPGQSQPKRRPVNFARDVRTVLSDNCFACHGPVDKTRRAGLRLDTNVIAWGKYGTPERLRIGDLPPTGKWVRLEVETKKLGLAPGTVIDGWAFTQQDGTVYWDRAGIEDLDAPGRPALRFSNRLDPGSPG